MSSGSPGWRVSAVAATALAMCLHGHAAQQQPPFVERVDVARVLIDVRVFDDAGRPVTGLAPSDFEVKLDGRVVRVESAEWTGARVPAHAPLPPAQVEDARDSLGSGGRLVVILVQKSLEAVRIVGIMRMVQLLEPLFEQLMPDDRVALLSFDSHLRIWSDFTTDSGRVRSMLQEDIVLRHPLPVNAGDDVSLMRRLDQGSARSVHSIEHALRRIGEALEPLPGAKSLVLLGYGFGRFNASTGGVTLMDGFDEASAALQRARVTVFSLNVTQANFNSLQAGLQTVAATTGGFYASTYEFPMLAMKRLAHAIEGHYVLFVEKPGGAPGEHRIDVRLHRTRAHVFARRTYID